MAVTNDQILAAVKDLGSKIDTVNGRVRENETAIAVNTAVLTGFKVSETKAREDLEDEVGTLRNRQNLFSGALAAFQTVAAIFFGFKE